MSSAFFTTAVIYVADIAFATLGHQVEKQLVAMLRVLDRSQTVASGMAPKVVKDGAPPASEDSRKSGRYTSTGFTNLGPLP